MDHQKSQMKSNRLWCAMYLLRFGSCACVIKIYCVTCTSSPICMYIPVAPFTQFPLISSTRPDWHDRCEIRYLRVAETKKSVLSIDALRLEHRYGFSILIGTVLHMRSNCKYHETANKWHRSGQLTSKRIWIQNLYCFVISFFLAM